MRLGVVLGECYWYGHAQEDEFFVVISGRLFVDLREESVELGTIQGPTVPRAVEHRTLVPERTTPLKMAGANLEQTGHGSERGSDTPRVGAQRRTAGCAKRAGTQPAAGARFPRSSGRQELRRS